MAVDMCITLFIILFIGVKGNDLLVKKFFLPMDNLKVFHKVNLKEKNRFLMKFMFSTEYPQVYSQE